MSAITPKGDQPQQGTPTRNLGGLVLASPAKLNAICHKARKRAVYVTYLTYWAIRHRSIENARWIVAFDGHTW